MTLRHTVRRPNLIGREAAPRLAVCTRRFFVTVRRGRHRARRQSASHLSGSPTARVRQSSQPFDDVVDAHGQCLDIGRFDGW
ncbi:MAG TPA: hypothetical protein VKB59_19500, partial [Micromonosporaceae bacterium]|nr:hypothetical protein [Micromonosporaceae bacterium]